MGRSNMTEPGQVLREFRPRHEFFIGIDSDGCVFDTMELKHKECFAPMFIKYFQLQPASRYAREVWEFVNLYSKTRGANRFPALARSLQLLRERPEVSARQVRVAESGPLEDWIARENRLGNAALAAELARGNTGLAQVKQWSDAVNQCIEEMVEGVPPFPFFRESVAKMRAKADTMVISQTPVTALEREWREHGIRDCVGLIAGQELGTKRDHLRLGAGGKYSPEKILMIGDAPGDLKAARATGALFYPIVPGREEHSWKRLHDEALERFFSLDFSGEYEAQLVREFEASLPERPPWEAQ